ncbi:cytochrome c oxidase subunit 2 [Paenibacillus castaneae]|uniref:cupredoxin domain-containing protein n=1 Tax=Paenibacillus castaneae TaxID=474957 RepID=UPI000C9A1445|nr:cupredoxin domain-containing protein [Paenibacillus castaneae]NIK79677.1 cytochrome c oxidase subunit 2 [Paenibacillus castaneae]
MNRKLYLVLTITALAIVMALSACGKTNNTNKGGTPSQSPAAGGGGTKEITVTAKNFEFDQPDIKLKVGDTVKLTLKNDQGNHGLAIPELNVSIKNGESATFTVDKAGSYAYNCSIQCGAGHDNMVGTITVS